MIFMALIYKDNERRNVSKGTFLGLLYFNMQVKKQLRWLLFLIIPFIIVLAIHVIVPTTFILNSNPIFEAEYLNQQFHGQQLTVRSTTMGVRLAISLFFKNIVNSQKTFLSMYKAEQEQYISINVNSIEVNNAYNYSKRIKNQGYPLNTTQNIGMWFLEGKDSVSQLTAQQISMFDQFKRILPFFDSLFAGEKSKFVHSTCLYIFPTSINAPNPMYLEYPSSYSSKYTNLNASVLDKYYIQSMNTYASNNYSQIIIPFIQLNEAINLSMLLLCIPDRTDTYDIVGCLRLQMQLLSDYFQDQSYLEGGVSLNKILVLSNDIEGSIQEDPQILLSFDNDINTRHQTPTDLYFNISEPQIPSQTFNTPINDYNGILYINQKNISTYFVAPILKFRNMITMHLITTHTYQGIQNISGVLVQKLRQFLIPISLLSIIAIFLSYYVMKTLLASIDKELYELQKRLLFIADGDIYIEIPSHEGTKDIKKLYDSVKIINKLHRYSTEPYFRGYFPDKMLKYNEALQFMKSLNYDTGNILENMGEAAMYSQEWQTAMQILKKSVHLQLQKIKEEFGTLDEMIPLKKTGKVPSRYKQMEIILIRKIFKLNMAYLRYLELKPIFANKEAAQTAVDQTNFKKKQEKLMQEATQYMNIQKKAFYPDYSSASECIISFFTECKQFSNLGKVDEASQVLAKASKILEKYIQDYPKITKLLKEKGSKNKLLKMKNRLTTHSRVPPDILKTFKSLFEAKILSAEQKNPSKYNKIVNVLFEGFKAHTITTSLTYMSVLQIRKALIELKIDLELFESTQLFRQSLPWKALHYGPITKEDETSFLKYPTRFCQGLDRQFVFIFDCSRELFPIQGIKLREYQKQICIHIFEKLLKKKDRMSIIRHGVQTGVEVYCGLIFKEFSEDMLKNNLAESIEARYQKKQQIGLIEAFCRGFYRMKDLKSEKVIIMFFKSVEDYRQQFKRRLRKKRRAKRSKNQSDISEITDGFQPEEFGQVVENLMQQDNVRNVKLICYCANGEEHQVFRQFFGLNLINKRIWSKYGGVNKDNNVVYVVEEKHKPDIDRILMLKAQFIAENHVFFL